MWAWLITLSIIIKLSLQKTYIHFYFSFTKKECQRDNFVLSAKPLKSQAGINRNKYRPFKNYQEGENSYSVHLSGSNSHPGQKSFP